MVLNQPLDIVVECVQGSGGQKPGLPHAPAKHLADTPCEDDEVLAAGNNRATGAPRPLEKHNETESA